MIIQSSFRWHLEQGFIKTPVHMAHDMFTFFSACGSTEGVCFLVCPYLGAAILLGVNSRSVHCISGS